MKYTNYYYYFIILVLLIGKINCVQKNWVSKVGVGSSDYDTSTNWDPQGVPTQDDDVYFGYINQVQLNDAVLQGHKNMKSLEVDVDDQFAIGNLNIDETLINYYGKIEFAFNISAIAIRNDYIMVSGYFSHIKAIVYNNYLMVSYGSAFFEDDYYGRPGSYFTNFSNGTLQEFKGHTQILGEIEFVNCYSSFQFLNITNGGYLTVTNSSTFIKNDLYIDFGGMEIEDTDLIFLAEAVIFDQTNITLHNSTIMFSNDYLIENRSVMITTINSEFRCLVKFYQSKFHLFYNTLFLGQNSYILMYDSSLFTLDRGYLIMVENSLIQIDHSNAVIFDGSHYLQDNAWFVCLNGSATSINGSFIMKDNSQLLLYINSILFTYHQISLFDDSTINIADNSTLSTLSSVELFSTSTLVIESSLCAINGSIALYDESKYLSLNSKTALNGEFIANGTVYVVFESSLFLVYKDFTSMFGATTIFNDSLVQIQGSLKNIDSYMFSVDSQVIIFNHLYSQGLVSSNNTNFTVEGGNFEIDGQFIGNELNISLFKGNLTMMTLESTFVCNNCNISLLAGYISILNSSIDGKEYFDLIGGRIQGIGTFNGNVQSTGEIGSDDVSTNNITINGSFNINNGKVIMVVDSLSDFSTILILNKINVTSTIIEIRINEDFLNSLEKNQTIDLITYKSIVNNNNDKNNNGVSSSNNNISTLFNNIAFKTYKKDSDPKESNSCQLSVTESSSKFQLLISSSDCNSKNSTSKAWIAGVIIPIVFIVGISMAIYHYRNRLSIFYKLKKQTFDTKLQSFKNKK